MLFAISPRKPKFPMPTISQSAKARGQTGFLKEIHHYSISASSKYCADQWFTTNKREAYRKYKWLLKCTKDGGRYSGARIVLECDGVEIENNQKS